jgi:peptidoglycan-N-acetylglucosamine deacetylase
MRRGRGLRFLLVTAVVSTAGGLAAMPAGGAPAGAATPPPLRSEEGPSGPPARLPDGRVAAPPRVTGPLVATGCPAAAAGAAYYAPGKGKTVALTFDDGPGASTASMISVLRSAGVTATFFNLGQNAAARPQVITGEARMSYLLGNHTWDHQDMSTLPAAAQATELDRATAEQETQAGVPPCAFRSPGGAYTATTLRLAAQRRMQTWMWSVDTEDWKAHGSSSSYWVNRIIALAKQEGGALQHPVVLMHNQPAGNPATVRALPEIIRFFRSRGYAFVNLLGDTGTGYLVLTAHGGVRRFGPGGPGPAGGSTRGSVRAVAMAANPATGGYWVLKSDGGVDAIHAPWLGSVRRTVAAGNAATAIAASRGGYLVLTSDGGVHAFGTRWYGSDKGRLPAGVRPAGLAADPATGGYWILRSGGGVDAFHAPWFGSARGKLAKGTAAVAIAAGPDGGYLILAASGGVRTFGTRWYGSDKGRLPAGVTPIGLATAPATGGYWILRSDGGADAFHAPWHGSLRGTPQGTAATAIAGL